VTLNASGFVVARRMSTVSANVTGKIAEIFVEEGAIVTAGQELARLDDAIARAQLALYESRIELAQTALAEVAARLAHGRRELQRLRVLAGKGLASESSFDAAQSEVEALEAQLATAQKEILVGQRELALSREQLDELVIRAPFPGVVVSQSAQPGEIVSPVSAGDSYTRTGISTIVDMSSLEVEVDVNESYVDRVRPGQGTEAVLEAYPDWRIPGHVLNIVPAVNRQKGTVKVRVAFDALDPRILPNMGVQVEFLADGTVSDGQMRADRGGSTANLPDPLVRDG